MIKRAEKMKTRPPDAILSALNLAHEQKPKF